MPADIADEALDFLLARAGLDLSAAQKAELKTVYPGIAAMAELAHVYSFTEDDLGEDAP